MRLSMIQAVFSVIFIEKVSKLAKNGSKNVKKNVVFHFFDPNFIASFEFRTFQKNAQKNGFFRIASIANLIDKREA
jgi:hypothetical protein